SLDAVQDHVVAAEAVLPAVGGADSQDSGHQKLLPILLHRDTVLLQPAYQRRPPPLHLLPAAERLLLLLRAEQRGEPPGCLGVRLPQHLHLLHRVAHHHGDPATSRPITELHQDHAGHTIYNI
ncbi:hypothetical protein CRUP_031610, partial [Coryphaenoides rupestris]